MYELQYNGQIYLLSSEKAAEQYAKDQGWGTYSIFPPGTLTNQPEYE